MSKIKKPWQKVELLVYENEEGISRIEYKGRVIQNYGYEDGEDISMCHFVMKEDGNDDKEFFCLLEAIRYVDRVSK